MGLLVISFDAVGDKIFEQMANSNDYPNIAKFKQNAYYQGGVKTIFVSNTYPIHTSVSTGKYPKDHNIISNLLPQNKNGEYPWAQMSGLIKSKTIWESAKEKGLTTAAFLWPVTCGAKIDYNLPEVHLLNGQSRIFRHLLYGSKFFQIYSMLKFRGHLKNMKNIETLQPQLDNFTTAVAANLISRKNIDLACVHLIAYDHICHLVGPKSIDLEIAKKSLDKNLGILLNSWNGIVMIFSDHSQLMVNECINLNLLNELYFDKHIEFKTNKKNSKVDLYNDFLQLGGCAFGNKLPLNIEDKNWFGRYLTQQEMEESGYNKKYKFGFSAKEGFSFSEKTFKGDHGYPVNYNEYGVFYAVNKEIKYKNKLKSSIFDVSAIIAKELGLDMDILNEYGI